MSKASASALALAALLAACGRPTLEVDYRVVPLGDDPFAGADTIAVSVEHAGTRISTTRFAVASRAWSVPEVPFGTDYTLIVEPELSGLVLGRGRSFPFDLPTPTTARPLPDVTVGVLGRFAPLPAASDATAFATVAATSDGALLAGPAGFALWHAHDAVSAHPSLDPRAPWPAARVGGATASIALGVLVVGGAAAGATFFDATGAVLGELGADVIHARSGAAVVAVDAQSALVVGGEDASGARIDDVVRVTWSGSALSARALTPLPAPRHDARAVALDARTATATVRRVLVMDGTTAAGDDTSLVLLDPLDLDPPVVVTPAPAILGSAACALATGLVLLAGGHDTTGAPSAAVRVLVVQPDQHPPLALLSPAPPSLFRARDHAFALPFGTSLALVLGGIDASGTAVAETELVDLGLVPGSVVLTGSLPSVGVATIGARLHDHTLLVASDASLALYFPPRGE